MISKRIIAVTLLVASCLVGYGLFSTTAPNNGYVLGLDLSGGTRLLYTVQTGDITGTDLQSALSSLRDTVERRVNTFGVSEPVVYPQTSSIGSEKVHRLLVELPNVSDLETATQIIGDTPVLEFKALAPNALASQENLDLQTAFVPTGLTGEYLKKAQVQFANSGMGASSLEGASVGITFNSEGAKLFADLTKQNLGQPLAIYLDGELLSAPIVQSEIVTGEAVITGNFTVEEAQLLAKRLNAGALPLPIVLESSEIVTPVLGESALVASIKAGIVALIVIGIFMTVWYRLPGFLATLALVTYSVLVLVLFKFIPVTLSAAGIAGFIISIGIAVDANILIFERSREELLSGKDDTNAFMIGFARAWPSIRDSNISSLISAVILFWFGTSVVKGFALTFGIGVLVSMITAISVTRAYLKATTSSVSRWWLLSGFSR
jgi:protein-export membrane protein SecD